MKLRKVPKPEWPSDDDKTRVEVWLNDRFLVQVFERRDVTRLSVNRVTTNGAGRWEDNITWDDLQIVKRQCGFGDMLAVEVYPEDRDVVNDANMRHLWVLDYPICGVGWTKSRLIDGIRVD